MEMKKRALGKGLSALIPDSYAKLMETQKTIREDGTKPADSAIQEIYISLIRPNRDQPRHRFSDQTIEELAASIREQGILQPIIARKKAACATKGRWGKAGESSVPDG